eukprot:scpid92014/ scgid9901/ 
MRPAPANLQHLKLAQRRALHILGPSVLLLSIEARRTVAVLSFLYKLLCLQGPALLTPMITPRRNAPAEPVTCRQCRQTADHPYQYANTLPSTAPNSLQRTFPFHIIDT